MAKPDVLDAVVVGGGLGGLTAATYLGRSGRTVALVEKSRVLGGRAVTQVKNGFHFNLGPHALYRGGAGMQVLKELDVRISGGVPAASGGYAVDGGRKHALPGGFVSLLTTGLLGLPGKLETAKLLGAIHKIDPQPIQRVPLREWLDRTIRHAEVRRLVQALVRVATYTHAPARQSAGAAVAQVQLALGKNVLYLDGGWQTLVDGLRAAAGHAGVRIVSGARVESIVTDTAARGVCLADGTRLEARDVVIAAGPAEAAGMLPAGHDAVLRQWGTAATPVTAACLDIGVSCLPRPRGRFALGIDQPLYFSVHSAVAKLAPVNGATIHVAKYLDPDVEHDPKEDERTLEGLLDLIQPGWREVVVERRFLPTMTVSHSLVSAAGGGTSGRPGPAVPGVDHLYVVGDWIGPEGQLADAALASGRRAARLIVAVDTAGAAAAA